MPSAELENLVRTGGLKPESRFDLAYNGAHASALAALRRLGYRAENRYLVFQTLPHTLGLPAATWRVLAKGHETRNLAEYEGASEVDERLVTDLIDAAKAVQTALRATGQHGKSAFKPSMSLRVILGQRKRP